jgi:hypothetical protein
MLLLAREQCVAGEMEARKPRKNVVEMAAASTSPTTVSFSFERSTNRSQEQLHRQDVVLVPTDSDSGDGFTNTTQQQAADLAPTRRWDLSGHFST